LGEWILGACNTFSQSIEDMVLEVAAQEGIKAESAEEAWKRMGGKIFTED
jgi:hypothetical protein